MARRTQRLLFGAILFGGVLGPVLLLFGLRLAASASVSLWLNLEAVATALLGFFVFRDRLGRNGWLGAGGILLSALLLTGGEGAAGVEAGLLVAAACFCWGLDNHLTALIDGISPAQSTFWKGLLAGLANLGIGLLVEPWGAQGLQVGLALLTGVFAYGLSITLYIGAAQALGATRSQLVFSTSPYFGIALAVLLLGESITPPQIAAAVLVAISVVLLTIESHSHEHDHPVAEHEHWHDHADGHHGHEHPPELLGPAGAETGTGATAGEAGAGSEDAGAGRAGALRGHSHRHHHPPLLHAHHHWPDLHHRHDH
jgi:drug/metabolite transporter (DMT)-like permease